jgi:hypothetical protein
MAWPSSTIGLTNLDAGSDRPSLARADIYSAVEALNNIIQARAEASGVAPLDASGYVPSANLSGAYIRDLLIGYDGAGSGLDADLLDGLQASAFLRTDLSTYASFTDPAAVSSGLQVLGNTGAAYQSSAVTFLTLRHQSTGTVAAGFGVRARVYLEDSIGSNIEAARVDTTWTDATSGSQDSRVAWSTQIAGTLTDWLRLEGQRLDVLEVASMSATPSTGRWFAYFKSDGLYIKDDGGTETNISSGTGGATDHGALTGLADDDHSQYLLVSGSRAMTGPLKLGTTSGNKHLILTDGTDAATPSSGEIHLYTKSQELYYRQADGTVVGPILAGGATSHGALADLLVDDHTQYLLRQPTADVVINDSGADYDFRIEGDTEANLFVVDAGYNTVAFGTAPSSIYRAYVYTVGAAMGGLFIQNGSSAEAFYVTSQSSNCFRAVGSSTGKAGWFERTGSATGATVPVVLVHDKQTSGTGGPALYVEQDLAGQTILDLYYSTTSVAKVTTALAEFNPTKSADIDFKVWGDSASLPAVFVDASADLVQVYSSATTGKLNVTAGSAAAAVYASGSGSYGVQAVATTGTAVYATVTSGVGFGGASTTGLMLNVGRTGIGSSITPVANLYSTSASDAGPILTLSTAGTGPLMQAYAGTDLMLAISAEGCLTFNTLPGGASTPASGYVALAYDSLGANGSGLYLTRDDGSQVGPLGTTPGSATANQTLRWDSGAGYWAATSALLLTATTATISTAGGGSPSLTVADTGAAWALLTKGGSVQLDFGGKNGGSVGGLLSLVVNGTTSKWSEWIQVSGETTAYTESVNYALGLSWVTNATSAPTNAAGVVRLYRRDGWLMAQMTDATEYQWLGLSSGTYTDNSVLKINASTGRTCTPESRFIIDDSGRVTITPDDNAETGLSVWKSFEVATNLKFPSTSSQQVRGAYFLVEADGDCVEGTVQGIRGAFQGTVLLAGSAGTWGNIWAVGANVNVANEGDIGNLYGFYSQIESWPISGTVNAAFAFFAAEFRGDTPDGGKWAFYQAGSTENSRLGGTLLLTPEDYEVYSLTPTSQLHLYRNTSGEHAWAQIENDNDGDGFIHFLLTGTKSWSVGVDNSDGDKFKVSESSSLGTSDRLLIDGAATRVNSRLGINVDPDANVACQINGVLAILDGVTAPSSSVTGYALIYVDTADGDLKIRFADGTVKTIETDNVEE